MTETRVEYRALVREPASFLASPSDRERGYTERWTHWGLSHEAVEKNDYDIVRSTETLMSRCPGGGDSQGPRPNLECGREAPYQQIVLVCGRGWGKQMALEQWEALWQEMFDNEEEE